LRSTGSVGKLEVVNIWSVPPLDLRRELRDERRDLLALLRNLSEDEWAAPTACVPWRVKEVALHLLDSDLSWLSRGRDGDMSSLIPIGTGYRRFVEALGQKNQRWVDAVSGLSPRVLMDLLEWSGEQVAAYHDSLQLDGPVNVVWAGGRVPRWLGLGRDFTERWVHQAQIREAVGKPGAHDRYLPTVLSVFVWAYPHQYKPDAGTGVSVNIDFGERLRWHLVRRESNWELGAGLAESPEAVVVTDADTAWRQLTGNPVLAAITTSGPNNLTSPLLEVRGIIV
jgi:uncharacterized protein (TIGR03083 family)